LQFLGGFASPQSRGRVGRRGSGMVPFERTFVTSYRLSMVTFRLSLRVSEILPLCARARHFFPTPPLVSPKFPYVPLGVGGWPLGYEERATVQLVSKISNLCDPDPPTSQTADRETDSRTTCSLNTMLCTSASRGKKCLNFEPTISI